MTNNKVFEKKIEQPDKSLYFKFIGTEKNINIDYQKLNDTLNKYFNETITINDIKEKITWLRTIFKDFEETYLELEITKENTKEKVIYIDKTLAIYQKNNPNKISFNYNINNNPNLSMDVTNINLKHYNTYKFKEEEISNNLKQLYKLTTLNPVELTSLEKVICLFYKSFYNEYPDFCDPNINIKMQTMINILLIFGVYLDDAYDFKLNSKKFPISTELTKTINRLIPLGKIESLDNTVRLEHEVEQYIKTIGKNIKDFVPKTENEIETLIKVSKIFYSGQYCMPTQAAIETISECCEIPIEEVESSLKLRKKIRQKLQY